MNDKKTALAKALKEEYDLIPDVNGFGGSNNRQDYPKAIEYLKTGDKPENYESSDLLTFVIDDFETICRDYGV